MCDNNKRNRIAYLNLLKLVSTLFYFPPFVLDLSILL